MDTSSTFVNRESELQDVLDAVDILQDEQRLLRKPIFEFWGVQGIGKSELLKQIKTECSNKSLFCVMEEAYNVTDASFEDVELRLFERRPVVIIIDALDATSAEQLQRIEGILGKFIENDKLFVVLAGRNIQRFDNTRTIARRLTLYPLRSLERESCLSYLDKCAAVLPLPTRNMIFEWTKGYPIAMKVMTDVMLKEQLDPLQDQEKIIHILMSEVVEKRLLASVALPHDKKRFQILLALLSVPRRFNLILIQSLVKKFAPEYELENSLAYIMLPPSINEVTSVLNWSLERAGYSIDAPVRSLFLLQYRIEQPLRYVEIHKFLADENERFIGEVNGSDSIRYLREFFYHLAYSEEEARVREILGKRIEQFLPEKVNDKPISLHTLDNFLPFYEEFQQDDELKEALKSENTSFALSRMRKIFIEIYRYLPPDTRSQYLRRFFSHTAHVAKDEDFALIFEDGMRQIIKQESSGAAIKLYQELIQDEELQNLLGKNFKDLKERISRLLEEGQ